MNNEPKQDCKHEEGWKMVEDKFGSYHVASGRCSKCGLSVLDWGEERPTKPQAVSEPTNQEDWKKELNTMVKNDLLRKGVVIVTWGEEDYKPRTELESELIDYIETNFLPKSQVREAIERAIEENQLIVEKTVEKLLRGECDKEFFTDEDAFLMIEKRLSAVDALTALSEELGLNQEAQSSEEKDKGRVLCKKKS